MRSTAVAAALVLVLAACDGGREEPEVPDPGPLQLAMEDGACSIVNGGRSALVHLAMDNTGEIPMTIDDVTLEGDNATLDLASVHDDPAVDLTLEAAGDPDATLPLELRVRMPDPALHSVIDSVAIDYHNVDGRFRAVAEVAFAVTSDECRRP